MVNRVDRFGYRIELKIQNHIGKITWSMADKLLYFLYGIVMIFQIRAMEIESLGLWALLISLYIWLFVIIDSFALQSLIQFGMNEENKRKVNTLAIIIQVILASIFASLIFLLRYDFAELFKEDNLVKVGTVLPILIFLSIPRTYVIKIIYRIQEFHKLFFVNLSFFGVMSIVTFYLIFTYDKMSFDDMCLIYYWGTATSSFLSIFIVISELKFGIKGNIKLMEIIKFAIPWTLYSAVNYFPKFIDFYFVQYFFGTGATGVYQSAKTLFRVFDESLNAAFGIIYPTAVKNFNEGNDAVLRKIVVKSISFLFLGYLILFLLLELGLSHVLILNILPESYHASLGQFNILLLATLSMPFVLMSSIITAQGNPRIVLKYAIFSLSFSMLVLFITGYLEYSSLIPLGIVVYLWMNALLIGNYLRKNMNWKFVDLFSAYFDTREYLKKIMSKKNV